VVNTALLTTAVQEYINANLDSDLKTLIFKKSPFLEVSMQELVAQIQAKKIAFKKLPAYYNTANIVYPPKLNLEQASSQTTAIYKANLMSGQQAADLTGGYGIDSYFISKSFATLDYFEHSSTLSQIAAHNFKQLGAHNIQVHNQDGITGAQNSNYDWIYVDPDRRSTGEKAFRLNQCSPDLTQELTPLLKQTNQLLIKTSPILDIHQALQDLPGVKEVHALAVQGELKELLFVIVRAKVSAPLLKAVDCTTSKTNVLEARYNAQPTATYGMPAKYLYIPNAAIMKLQLFGTVANTFALEKLHEHTHFYTSDTLVDFPGRVFTIKNVLGYNKKTMNSFTGTAALLIARNFPLTVAQLRKRWKLADKEGIYLIFTTLVDGNKVVLECELN